MITINFETGGFMQLEDEDGIAISSAWQASLDHGVAVIVIQGDKWINVDQATVAKMLDPDIISGMTEDRHL